MCFYSIYYFPLSCLVYCCKQIGHIDYHLYLCKSFAPKKILFDYLALLRWCFIFYNVFAEASFMHLISLPYVCISLAVFV